MAQLSPYLPPGVIASEVIHKEIIDIGFKESNPMIPLTAPGPLGWPLSMPTNGGNIPVNNCCFEPSI